ncbi:hypothetical protein [Bacillus sp. 1P06AnD]|uniref:hypothetical protein n=1 Tax=Bacillus sp. 1P06AnD TaxID=3132208 RepID=UPI00399F188D
MKKSKIITTVTGIVSIIMLSFFIFQNNKDIKNIEKICSALTNSISFKNYLKDADSHYDHREQLITIKLDLENTFDNLDHSRQFGFLEYYNKQFRYFMRQGLFTSSLFDCDLIINARTDNNRYYLQNTLPIKNSPTSGESVFYKNDDKLLTTSKYKKIYKEYLKNDPESYRDQEVLEYAYKFYSMLTRSGKYFKPKRDAPIILNTIQDKFDISPPEFDEIYKKRVMGITDASVIK